MQEEQTTQTTAQIAVIVPVYNPGQYLHACVDSILAQTYRDYELILVDDGSTDGSGRICDDYAAQDPRVSVVHKENGGLMSAWMRGVAESAAPYLFFVDSDDWVDQDALEQLAQGLSLASCDDPTNRTLAQGTAAKDPVHTTSASGTAAKDPMNTTAVPGAASHDHVDTGSVTRRSDVTTAPRHIDAACRQIVCAGCMIEREWNHTSTPEGNAAPAGVYEGERLQREIRNRLLGNEIRRILPSRCMKLIDRRLIEDNLNYCDPSLRMGEDLNIMAPALLDADRVVLLENAYIYHYRYVAASMVHGYDAGLYDNVRRLIAVMRKVLTDKDVPDAQGQVHREFVYLFLLTLKNEIRRTGVPATEIVSRMQALCDREHSRELLSAIGGRTALTTGANRLLALIMERPTTLRIRIVRLIFLLKG